MNQNVPFSWENKPGVSKVAQTEYPTEDKDDQNFVLKLPPPPCPPAGLAGARNSVHGDLQIPLPRAFRPLSRSSSPKSLKKYEDPFFAAFEECTKSNRKSNYKSRRFDLRSGLRSFFSVPSCKSHRSCAVGDNNFVRVSQLPFEKE